MPQVLATPRATARPTAAVVRAPLTFITRSDSKPVFHSAASTGGAPRVLFETERHTVGIHDLRPLVDALSLDPYASQQMARGSSRSMSGGRSAGPCSARRSRSPTSPPSAPRI